MLTKYCAQHLHVAQDLNYWIETVATTDTSPDELFSQRIQTMTRNTAFTGNNWNHAEQIMVGRLQLR